jgi:hypothetical protein
MTDHLLIITKCERISPACPSSWDCVTDEGRYLHIKYRYGTISVREFIKDNDHEIMKEELYSKKISTDDLSGIMTFDVLRKELLPFAIIICNETGSFEDIDDYDNEGFSLSV